MSKEQYIATTFDGYGTLTGGIFIDDYGDVYVANFYDPNVAEGAAEGMNDGGVIAHGLGNVPTLALLTGTVAGERVTVTSIDSVAIMIAIKKPDGSPGTEQTVYWHAKYIP